MALWASIKTVYTFPDVGRHFKCQVMLHYLLIDFVKKHAPRVVLQFLPGGHGKTGVVDGVIFGKSGVGGAVQELRKLERLRTTAQLVAFCASRKEKHMQDKGKKYRDLHRWVHIHMLPPPYPRKCTYLEQARLMSLLLGVHTQGR